jgi:hypothetical protein
MIVTDVRSDVETLMMSGRAAPPHLKIRHSLYHISGLLRKSDLEPDILAGASSRTASLDAP